MYGDLFSRYMLDGKETINGFTIMAGGAEETHKKNPMTTADYLNRVDQAMNMSKTPPDAPNGEEHGVWKALWNNNIRLWCKKGQGMPKEVNWKEHRYEDQWTLKDDQDKDGNPMESNEIMDGIFRCLAIVLHLGDIKFKADNKSDPNL